MAKQERIPCEFFLVRYVPDVVKGEFTNIGVVLREVHATPSSSPSSSDVTVRFTQDWTRVQCMEPNADIAMLEALEAELASRLLDARIEAAQSHKPLLTLLADTLSNGLQITEPRACLTENVAAELDQLMKLYVEPLPRLKIVRQRSARGEIVAEMRRKFEEAGAWTSMKKRIAASLYTRRGDPLRLDCGYKVEGVSPKLVRIFHAVSLESDVEGAKALAYSRPRLHEGVARVDAAELELTAVVEPLRSILRLSGDAEPEDQAFQGDAFDLYGFGVETMERQGIRVITANDLARAADTARIELGL